MNSGDSGEHQQRHTTEISPGELRLLRYLSSLEGWTEEPRLSPQGMSAREISSAVSWLESKNLIDVEKRETVSYSLLPEGERFISEGIPEARAYRLILQSGSVSVADLMRTLGATDGRIGLAQLAKFGIKPSGGKVSSIENQDVLDQIDQRSRFLNDLKTGARQLDREMIEHFRKRENVIDERKRLLRMVRINESGKEAIRDSDIGEDAISELTPEIMSSESWRGRNFQRYDLNSRVERVLGSGIHPVTYIARIVRDIFVQMGFKEMGGHYIEYSAWNMDSLFIPQDHPARDMQDTFYVTSNRELEFEHPEALGIFKRVHEKGMRGYTGWGYKWSDDRAKQLLLRTHTTVSTIRYLYEHRDAPQAVFSVEKVFRHESVDWKHLAELHQIEGGYYGKDANLATLKWLMKEFYSRLGFRDLRFVPSYYPYTEPSMDVVAMVNGKEMELGGSGVFRREVTKPIGLKYPVIAWGLGMERLAMIYFGLDDIRDIYQSDLDWLRTYRIRV